MASTASSDASVSSDGTIWIFGYGSLVHTPNFEYSAKGSTDHRGTPQRPGRTVTLTATVTTSAAADSHPDPNPGANPEPEALVTWGAAFQLAGTPEEQAATLSYLEWREKQYDVRQRVDVYDRDGRLAVRGALTYIASPANANYLGPADPRDIAAQIAASRGPSGPNAEYLFRLADAMRAMGVTDPELCALEEMVRQEVARLAAAAAPERQAGGGASTAGAGRVEAGAEEAGADSALAAELEHHLDFRRRHQLAQQRAAAQQAAQQAAAVQQWGGEARAEAGAGAAVAVLEADKARCGGERGGGELAGAPPSRHVYAVQAVCGQGGPSGAGPG
ncbi:hypothetical protein GPECTOR_60g711 [Gonium pectorale]|uniref:glutathione-specific gamma-glutamylcyclotransferase n=1 Tax=Gonium pectorale TaxID=33097 RepID=A0A150G532_GONPE|nr:hypothetical protein GPECTOR_60g711 [Gonium pectorale]|eukprot:KXZ44934.1 hypothetical protein GPECTOR_60g711 [Gonium pectorale]